MTAGVPTVRRVAGSIQRPTGTQCSAGAGRGAAMSGGTADGGATRQALAPRSTSAARVDRRTAALLPELLREIGLLAELLDQAELRLEPVEVILLALEDVLEQVPRRVVSLGDAEGDRLVQPRDGVDLEIEVELELLRNRLADTHAAELLEVRQALEEEDALDELVRVLHLVDRLLVDHLGDAQQAPVLAHAGVEEVLVDADELGGEHVVQGGDHLRVALHDSGVSTGAPPEPGETA